MNKAIGGGLTAKSQIIKKKTIKGWTETATGRRGEPPMKIMKRKTTLKIGKILMA